MSGTTLSSVKINAGLDIRNSRGTVHSKLNQVLWLPGRDTNDDDTNGSYHGSLYPASDASGFSWVRVVLEFALPSGVSIDWSSDVIDLTFEEPSGKLQWKEPSFDTPNQVEVYFMPSYANKKFPWGFAGDITWTLAIGGQTACVQTTRLELYSLHATLPAFYHGVIEVGFLRAMVLKARPESSDQTWTDYVANAVFSKFGFQYDIEHGSMKYANGYNGGPFDLRRWVRGINKSNLVNCYDQAAIVQIALGLGPPDVKATWMYMVPYGFINNTYLVGYPNNPCNNPFGKTAGNLEVGTNDEKRTYFSNHAFVSVTDSNGNSTIVDACAGPSVGTITLEQYVANAIQPEGQNPPVQTTCYSLHPDPEVENDPSPGPGTASDASEHYGVSALDACDIRTQANDKKQTDNSKAIMAIAHAANPDKTVYAVSVSALQASILSAYQNLPSWDVDVYLNPEGLEVTWDVPNTDLSKPRETEITLYVCSNYDRAAKTFENELIGNSAPWASTIDKPTGPADVYGTTPDQLMVTTKAGGSGSDFIAHWVRGNVAVSVSGMANSVDDFWTRNSLTQLDTAIAAGGELAALSSGQAPNISFSGNEQPISCNDVFTLVFTVSCGPIHSLHL